LRGTLIHGTSTTTGDVVKKLFFSGLAAVFSASMLASCIGHGTLDSCAGGFAGTFEGTRMGTVSGSLYLTEMDKTATRLALTFLASGDPPLDIRINSSDLVRGGSPSGLVVTSTGTFTGARAGFRVTGAINFDDCSMTGNWMNADGSGTFKAEWF
jgi:hypothetical protein